MTGADRLETIKSLVDQATEISTHARDRFLRDACGDDSSIFGEVMSLVALDKETAPWPEAPLLDGGTALRPGQVIGPYRVESSLGEGGMGRVALAVRERDFTKQVALKVIRGPLTETSIRRFERERQILARLEHPGIARLLDGGQLDDGRPWLAMEPVEGQRIDRFCDAHHLDVRQRAELVIAVCDALDAAHQMQVVHRDIKPSNLLVTADGRPKLLDFGIAKQLERDATEPTGPSDQPMTLRWAAPEQLTGGPISPATDVHGIGLLLYRLLTGRHAFGGLSRAELTVAIPQHVPSRPSWVVADPSRRHALAGDLDAIVGKALRKDPEERYASVRDLADDLIRYRDGLPVKARAFDLVDRAGRVWRRHWKAISAAGVMVLVAALGLVANMLRVDAEAARDEAAEARGRSERAFGFVTRLLYGVNPDSDKRDAIEFLKAAEERVDGFSDEALQGKVLEVIGRTYAEWGELDSALNAWQRSLGLFRGVYPSSLYPRGHPDLVRALNNLAGGYFLKLDNRQAIDHYSEALGMKEALVWTDIDLGKSYANLATAQMRLGKLEDVESLYLESLSLLEAEEAPGNPATSMAASSAARDRLERIGRSHRGLAAYYLEVADPAASESSSRKALGYLLQSTGGRETTRIASVRNGLGRALHDQGKVEEALEQYSLAYVVRGDVFGSDHPHVASSHLDLSHALIDLERFGEAPVQLRQAAEWLDNQPAHRHANYRARTAVLTGLLGLRQGSCEEQTADSLRTGFESLIGDRERLDHYGRRAKGWLSEFETTCGVPVQMAAVH